MKRMVALLLVILVAFSLCGCGASVNKQKVFKLVENNYDEISEACRNQDINALLAIEGIKDVEVLDGYVVVFCEGKGIAPSSQDYGFYYTKYDIPVTVDCNMDIVCDINSLTPEGNGYECTVNGNVFYTENIKSKIYFYSNAY